jgi:hypothetical protein
LTCTVPSITGAAACLFVCHLILPQS